MPTTIRVPKSSQSPNTLTTPISHMPALNTYNCGARKMLIIFIENLITTRKEERDGN